MRDFSFFFNFDVEVAEFPFLSLYYKHVHWNHRVQDTAEYHSSVSVSRTGVRIFANLLSFGKILRVVIQGSLEDLMEVTMSPTAQEIIPLKFAPPLTGHCDVYSCKFSVVVLLLFLRR